MWFVFAFASLALASENIKLATVFAQVVGTFPIVTLSLLIVPMTFSIHNACSRYDYRWYAVASFLGIALLCGAYYWFTT